MYKIKLKKGDVVHIYTDYRNELKFEGKAKLLEKVKKNDVFYLDNEEVFNEESYKNPLVSYKKISKKTEMYFRLNAMLDLDRSEIKLLLRNVKNVVNKKKLDNYNAIHDAIKTTFTNLKGSGFLVTIRNEYSIDYLTRYFQQKYYENWTPSLFCSERWLVEFIPQNNFEKSFRTYRNIRYIVANSPEDAKMSERMTYNGLTRNEYKRMKNKKAIFGVKTNLSKLQKGSSPTSSYTSVD